MVAALPEEMIKPLIATIPLGRVGEPEDVANAFLLDAVPGRDTCVVHHNVQTSESLFHRPNGLFHLPRVLKIRAEPHDPVLRGGRGKIK